MQCSASIFSLLISPFGQSEHFKKSRNTDNLHNLIVQLSLTLNKMTKLRKFESLEIFKENNMGNSNREVEPEVEPRFTERRLRRMTFLKNLQALKSLRRTLWNQFLLTLKALRD